MRCLSLWKMFRRSTSSYSPHNTTESVREKDDLKITGIDLNIKENAEQHRTSEYLLPYQEEPPLVLRRGSPFRLTINIKPRDPKTYWIKVQMKLADRDRSWKSSVYLDVDGKEEFTADENKWDVCVEEAKDHQQKLKVQVPYNCQVGEWKCSVRIGPSNGSTKFQLSAKEKIYILFNPWNKDDQCYFPNTQLLDEYILNTSGVIYFGTHNNMAGRPWFFGQFNKDVLAVIEMILSKTKVNRSNAVEVARALTSQVNSANGGGILVGRWTGDYEGGKAPFTWVGSSKIISQYLKSGQPVRYGQCWVFSGVLTTVLRGLGLPSRSVTNFKSAHDKDASLSIDRFYNESGEPIDGPSGRSGDSIWNFHVWNEVWMARPDLPDNYGGWQVVDSTPQERSNNLYQCGPCPVLAIKEGMVGLGYDGPFIYAEVNADISYWVQNDEAYRGFMLAYSNTDSVGLRILTNSPGDKDAEDITSSYKYKEGSNAERVGMMNARHILGADDKYIYNADYSGKKVEFNLNNIKSVDIGQSYTSELNIKNVSSDPVNVQGVFNIYSAHYNGVTAAHIKKFDFDVNLDPDYSRTVSVKVSPGEYMNKLVERCVLHTHVVACVKGSNQVFVDSDDYVLNKPTLKIKVEPLNAAVNIERKVTFSFVNPLSQSLTGIVLAYGGDGIDEIEMKLTESVRANDVFRYTATVVPRQTGKVKIVANLNCEQIYEIVGHELINVS